MINQLFKYRTEVLQLPEDKICHMTSKYSIDTKRQATARLAVVPHGSMQQIWNR
jgi:hypothetical protein